MGLAVEGVVGAAGTWVGMTGCCNREDTVGGDGEVQQGPRQWRGGGTRASIPL